MRVRETRWAVDGPLAPCTVRLFAAGPDALALLTENNRRAGILTEWQHSVRRHFRIAQHGQRNGAVVLSRLRIVENRSHLLQVLRAQFERDLFHRGFRQIRQRL